MPKHSKEYQRKFLRIGGVNSSTTATHSSWPRKNGLSAPPGMVGMIWNTFTSVSARKQRTSRCPGLGCDKLSAYRADNAASVADFLQRALVAGAIDVIQLEAEARAAGLLGKRQQIQHAKAFKRVPKEVPAHRWRQFINDCHTFLLAKEKWAERAAGHGWNDLELFGCCRRPLERLGNAGLLWAINGGRLVELRRDWAVIERASDRSRHVHQRERPKAENLTLPWIGLR